MKGASYVTARRLLRPEIRMKRTFAMAFFAVIVGCHSRRPQGTCDRIEALERLPSFDRPSCEQRLTSESLELANCENVCSYRPDYGAYSACSWKCFNPPGWISK